MANSGRRTVNYTPRMTDAQAYEKLPPTLKRVLQEAVTEWSSYATLRHFEKHGLPRTIDWIHAGDEHFMRQGHKVPFKKSEPSTFVACKVKPLRTYGITRNTRISQEQSS